VMAMVAIVERQAVCMEWSLFVIEVGRH
jgi:hypothetical protein